MMWSRMIEALLGCWLMISPFVFLDPAQRTGWWFNDLVAGFLVVVLALLSYWRRTRRAHLLTLVVACGLIGLAYWQGFGDAPPASQNHMLIGVLLLMFAVVPNEASRPAPSWEKRRRGT